MADDNTPVGMDKDGYYINANGQRVGSAFSSEYKAAVDRLDEKFPIQGPGLATGRIQEQSTQGRRMARGGDQEYARESKRMARSPSAPNRSEYDPNRVDELDMILAETGPDQTDRDRILREARQTLALRERDMLMGDEPKAAEAAARDKADMWSEPVRGRGFSDATPIRPGLRPAGVGQDDYLRVREQYPRMVDASERARLASMVGQRELDAMGARQPRAITPEQAGAQLDRLSRRYDETMGRLSPEEAAAIFGQLEAEKLKHDRALAAASGGPVGSMGPMARR